VGIVSARRHPKTYTERDITGLTLRTQPTEVALLKFYAKPTALQAHAQPFVRESLKQSPS
jgi:hypothetical protein